MPALVECGGFPPNLGGNTDSIVRPKSNYSAYGVFILKGDSYESSRNARYLYQILH